MEKKISYNLLIKVLFKFDISILYDKHMKNYYNNIILINIKLIVKIIKLA